MSGGAEASGQVMLGAFLKRLECLSSPWRFYLRALCGQRCVAPA